MNFLKPISTSLSPNTEKDDIWLAFKLIFQPWRWKKESAENSSPRLEEEFKNHLGTEYAVVFNSGRSALMAILNSLELKKNDEILLQAFTCNAAVNPVIWSGLKPVYVDCDERTFNIDIEDLKRKIGPRSKVLMVQHTFGLAAELDKILKICQKGEESKLSSSPTELPKEAKVRKRIKSSFDFAGARENNLILIEDCAHSLGADYKGKKVGTFGKAAFFSFSRDKVISSIYGGIAVTNDPSLAEKLRQVQGKFGYPSYCWIFQQLLHPVLMNFLILPTYRILGKYLLVLFQWLQILSKAVHWKEKRGKKPDYFPKRLPNALAILALNQFKKLERFNEHRKEIAEFYRQELKDTSFIELPKEAKMKMRFISSTTELPKEARWKKRAKPSSLELPPDLEQIYLRFTIKHPEAHRIIKKAWQKNILIGDWYDAVIAPHDTRLEKMQYIQGSCPKAEKLAKETLNLPTHINISQKDIQRIVDFLKPYGS